MSRKTCIVIGAGIGGIAAAYRLKQAGLNVTVYDQSDFVGGRMKSIDRNGFKIDVGAGTPPGRVHRCKGPPAGSGSKSSERGGARELCVYARGSPAHGQLRQYATGHGNDSTHRLEKQDCPTQIDCVDGETSAQVVLHQYGIER